MVRCPQFSWTISEDQLPKERIEREEKRNDSTREEEEVREDFLEASSSEKKVSHFSVVLALGMDGIIVRAEEKNSKAHHDSLCHKKHHGTSSSRSPAFITGGAGSHSSSFLYDLEVMTWNYFQFCGRTKVQSSALQSSWPKGQKKVRARPFNNLQLDLHSAKVGHQELLDKEDLPDKIIMKHFGITLCEP